MYQCVLCGSPYEQHMCCHAQQTSTHNQVLTMYQEKVQQLELQNERLQMELANVKELGSGVHSTLNRVCGELEAANRLNEQYLGQIREQAKTIEQLTDANRLLDEARKALEEINHLPGGTTFRELVDIRAQAVNASFKALVLLGKTEKRKGV